MGGISEKIVVDLSNVHRVASNLTSGRKMRSKQQANDLLGKLHLSPNKSFIFPPGQPPVEPERVYSRRFRSALTLNSRRVQIIAFGNRANWSTMERCFWAMTAKYELILQGWRLTPLFPCLLLHNSTHLATSPSGRNQTINKYTMCNSSTTRILL